VQPRLPAAWPEVALGWRRPDGTTYRISMVNPTGQDGGIIRATLDGEPLAIAAGAARVALQEDGGCHELRIELG
jgi:hypothetical protein